MELLFPILEQVGLPVRQREEKREEEEEKDDAEDVFKVKVRTPVRDAIPANWWFDGEWVLRHVIMLLLWRLQPESYQTVTQY